jgi:large subunit ribosomal protein L14
MIQVGTYLSITDNSGGKIGQCIKVLSKKRFACIGDKIIVSIKKTSKLDKVKEGSIHHAIIVRTKKEISRKEGTVIKFFNNSVILVDKENTPIGTRVFGIIPEEVRKKRYKKVLPLIKEII